MMKKHKRIVPTSKGILSRLRRMLTKNLTRTQEFQIDVLPRNLDRIIDIHIKNNIVNEET
jgi:hypothetical protein